MNKQKLRELCEAIVNGSNPDDVLAAGIEFMQEIDPAKTLALLDENVALLEALREIAAWTERYTAAGHPVSTVARAVIAKYSESAS